MEQEEDQLSNLPKIILHNVLSRLPEKDVARTSVLSKAWLETWYTFPNLSFCDSQFIGKSIQPVEDIVGTKGKFLKLCDYLMRRMLKFCDYVEATRLPNKRKEFIDYVKSRLARFQKQRLVIKEFRLRVKCFELSYMSEDVDLCLKLASESGVEVLELYNGLDMDEGRGECYVLPKSVIEVKSLTKLVLDGRIRVDQAFMNHSIKFFSLKELYLFHVFMEDEQAINHLISCCPVIEIITLMLYGGRMKSLSMHGLQKLEKVCVSGIKKVYIDEASSLKSLDYCHFCLDAPFKIDFIHCKYLKELLLRLNSTTIITNKWFLELFPKFPFLETLEIWNNCILSEKINISSVQLKYLYVSNCSNLKEANIDTPNLLSCKFDGFKGSKPIISFLNISNSSQLEVRLRIWINDDFDVFDVRELLNNIKPQNVMISLSLFIIETTMDAPNTLFLDISTPPPSIKHLDLRIGPLINYKNITLFSDLLHFLLLCCCPTTISFSLDAATGPFIEFFYETLMRRKGDDSCVCSSSYTKCWWHDLKVVKIANSMKNDEKVDLKTMLDSLPKFEFGKKIIFMLEF